MRWLNDLLCRFGLHAWAAQTFSFSGYRRCQHCDKRQFYFQQHGWRDMETGE